MFTHRCIGSKEAEQSWKTIKRTVSTEKTFQATEKIGQLAALDMLEFAEKKQEEIERIYVKFRDGTAMASGMRKTLPNVDVRYIVSQEKQLSIERPPITFFDEYDGYSSELLWFADPINATGHTTVESLRYVRKYFRFRTALISHVVANRVGIINVQTKLDDFSTNGFMNYAHLSNKLASNGYLEDGLELIPDFGDKLFGTLGSDFSIYDIRENMSKLMGTGAGDAEILKGTVLHLIQLANKEEYATDRDSTWITENWVIAALQWICAVGEFPFRRIHREQVSAIIQELYSRDFLKANSRPWKETTAVTYTLTEDGIKYASCVYTPIIAQKGIPNKLNKHLDFLIYLRPEAIRKNIKDRSWRF